MATLGSPAARAAALQGAGQALVPPATPGAEGSPRLSCPSSALCPRSLGWGHRCRLRRRNASTIPRCGCSRRASQRTHRTRPHPAWPHAQPALGTAARRSRELCWRLLQTLPCGKVAEQQEAWWSQGNHRSGKRRDNNGWVCWHFPENPFIFTEGVRHLLPLQQVED